jgi:hypothetical protein
LDKKSTILGCRIEVWFAKDLGMIDIPQKSNKINFSGLLRCYNLNTLYNICKTLTNKKNAKGTSFSFITMVLITKEI